MRISTKVVVDIESGRILHRDSYEIPDDSPVEKCCGASGAENAAQTQSSSFANTLQSNYNTSLAGQNQTLTQLNGLLNKITTGSTGPGFDPQERAALNTAAISAAGAANRNAQQAIGNFTSGQGNGGGSGIVSGVQEQLRAGAASSAANELASTQNQIIQADYNQGVKNAEFGAGGLEDLAREYGSEASGAMSGGIQENENSFNQASQINTQNQAWQHDLVGLGTAAVGGLASLATGGMGGSFSPFTNSSQIANAGLGPAVGAMQPSSYDPGNQIIEE